MIEKLYGKYHLTCDVCGEEHEDGPFDSFDEARIAGHSDGWTASSAGSGENKVWQNNCPNC